MSEKEGPEGEGKYTGRIVRREREKGEARKNRSRGFVAFTRDACPSSSNDGQLGVTVQEPRVMVMGMVI